MSHRKQDAQCHAERLTGISRQVFAGDPRRKTALIINPPVYDTQYWAEWSQPYGLVRIAALLRKQGYRHIDFFDFMEATSAAGEPADADDKRIVPKHRIHCDEAYADQTGPAFKARPYAIEKAGERLELFKYHFGETLGRIRALG